MEISIEREMHRIRDAEFISKLKDCYKLDLWNDELKIRIAIDVNAVLERMTNQRYSEMLRLLVIEGYTASEVAEMLDMKIDDVYNLKHSAIKQFIEIYGK